MDIYCANCGEPWGCTGLNHTNSDLHQLDFEDLVIGLNCPCCVENTGMDPLDPVHPYSEEYTQRWRSSVRRAAEGLVEPYDPAINIYQAARDNGLDREQALALARAETKYISEEIS